MHEDAQQRRFRGRIRGFYGLIDLPASGQPADAIESAQAIVAGGAQIVQLRMKHAPTRRFIDCGLALREWTASRNVLLCMNDRVDVANVVAADVVHLGQDDLPLAAARKQAGRMRIGISTHSIGQAQAALDGGADYLGFGPVFATRSKDNPDPIQGVDVLAEVCRLAGSVPVVALGGIATNNVALVAAAGAAAVAAIECIKRSPSPVETVAALHRALVGSYQAIPVP